MPRPTKKAPRAPLRVLLGRRLQAARERKGLSKAELARKLGISRAYYTHVEAGLRNPTVDFVDRVARALDASVAELFGEERPTERVEDPRAVRFAQLLEGLDEPARDAVFSVMERFAAYEGSDQ